MFGFLYQPNMLTRLPPWGIPRVNRVSTTRDGRHAADILFRRCNSVPVLGAGVERWRRGARRAKIQLFAVPLGSPSRGILRAGLRRNSNRDHFNLIGCSNSQVQRHSYVFRLGSLEDNEKFMLSLLRACAILR